MNKPSVGRTITETVNEEFVLIEKSQELLG